MAKETTQIKKGIKWEGIYLVKKIILTITKNKQKYYIG